MNQRCRLLVAAAVALTIVAALTAPASAQEGAAGPRPDLLLILDASGSMWGQIEGENKIVIARRVLAEMVDGLPEDLEVGLIAYGHRREGDCEDVETVVPMGPLDRGALKATVDGINPKGKTPITLSVERALALAAEREGTETVVLISDGLETCGGDPCKAVRAAREAGSPFVFHVVGFDLAGEDTSALECAAQAGGGIYVDASSAAELGEAFEQVVEAPPLPDGRLAVRVVADGELQDARVHVAHAETGEEAAGGRTYTSPDTNPRVLYLEDGVYDVLVAPIGIRSAGEERFQIEIVDGGLVEREFDYSSGDLVVGATRNGELGDATVRIYVAGTDQEVATGRTYTGAQSNPSTYRLAAGTYDVVVASVEISNKPEGRFEGVVVEPQGRAEVNQSFDSGTLKVGATRGGELADVVVRVYPAGGGSQVAQGRTYASASSNPKTMTVSPGDYRVEVQEVRGERAKTELTVTVEAGGTVEEMVDFGG